MRILLAGGAGTLGCDIIDALCLKHEILVIDDFKEAAEVPNFFHNKAEVLQENLANHGLIKDSIINFAPEIIVYLATTVSKDETRAFQTVQGLANIIEISNQIKLPRMIYIQSFLTRNSDSKIDSRSPMRALDSYSTWKLATEFLLKSFPGEKSTMILASVISPRLTVGAIPAFRRKILAGEPITVTSTARDYISPASFISALEILFSCDQLPEISVIGSGSPISTKEIAISVGHLLKMEISESTISEIEPSSSDPKTIALDDVEFSRWSGWSPTGDINDSIAKCLEFQSSLTPKLRLHH